MPEYHLLLLRLNLQVCYDKTWRITEILAWLYLGSPKIKLTKAMFHLQQITDSGKEVEEEARQEYDYEIESTPVEWQDSNVEELYDFISEIYR